MLPGAAPYQRSDCWRAALRSCQATRRKEKNDLFQWLEELAIAFSGHILTLSDRICIRWGEERARLERIGKPTRVIDSLIAATALNYNYALVTRNVENFRPFKIKIINPW